MWREPGDVEHERQAFAQRVDELVRNNLPVRIYAGCGDTPAAGFLNLDIRMHPRLRPDDPRWADRDLFLFPFADMSWPIADNSCDYIFHEDFFEHIPQKQQFMFLAETLRVLKPGEWHRVNTPCIAESMRRHSDFKLGVKGVWVDEWNVNGHVAVVSRSILTEMASLVGYRGVFFNQRNKGLSKHAYVDCRPGPDRDETLGNLFADLLK